MSERTVTDLLAKEAKDWDLRQLKDALQTAVALEHSTLPLYLFSWWTITPQNYTAYNLMRTVIMEEMVHMGLACNMLAALGEKPKIASLKPDYHGNGLPGGAEPDPAAATGSAVEGAVKSISARGSAGIHAAESIDRRGRVFRKVSVHRCVVFGHSGIVSDVESKDCPV